MSVALRSILRRTWSSRSASEALASGAGHHWRIRIKVMEGIKNINKFIIRVLVEAGSHGRDLSDACDLQKYPRIKRPPGATYKGRARHRAVLLSNLATTTGTSCAACLLCRAPPLRAAPALSHRSPQRPPIGNGYHVEKQKKTGRWEKE